VYHFQIPSLRFEAELSRCSQGTPTEGPEQSAADLLVEPDQAAESPWRNSRTCHLLRPARFTTPMTP